MRCNESEASDPTKARASLADFWEAVIGCLSLANSRLIPRLIPANYFAAGIAPRWLNARTRSSSDSGADFGGHLLPSGASGLM